jgi:hypothetical protein
MVFLFHVLAEHDEVVEQPHRHARRDRIDLLEHRHARRRVTSMDAQNAARFLRKSRAADGDPY